jgi:endonuclease/exonuclease/phosphatase family metal-dependent hydrolase
MPAEARISNRNDLIRDMIFELEPDFCSFQECNPTTSRAVENAIQDIISDRYAECAAEHAHENFTPVCYKKERFSELDSGFVPFSGLNDKRSKSLTWGLFEDKTDGKRVVVVSTHFWWKSTGEVDELQRADNANALLEVCDAVQKKYGELPVIISGDFNSAVNGLGYKTVTEGGFTDARLVAKSSDTTHTLHEYPTLTSEGVYVHNSAAPYKTIDFVFTYGKKPAVKTFRVLADDRAKTSSDHCPLVAEFEI